MIASPANPPPAAAQVMPPLVVDVDGTLVRTDLLHEAALQFLAHKPWQCWQLAAWLGQGKAVLKGQLARQSDPEVASLPLRDEVLALIRQAQTDGRAVYLASASPRQWIEPLAQHVGGISGVFATEGEVNLAGEAKAAALVAAFGHQGFDYIGDHAVDLPVWRQARRALIVEHRRGLADKVLRHVPEAQVIAREGMDWGAVLQAMRPHQWVKNLLVFMALLLGHRVFEWGAFAATCLGFAAFCLAASSAYILNDLLDLPGDREHPRKRTRPFAAGRLPVLWGPPLAAALLAAAIALASLIDLRFLLILLAYVGLTLSYSLVLKRRLLIDVIVLAGLYAIRVLAGVEAADAHQSPWLLMFSLFIFLSLAIVKRCAELVARRVAGQAPPPGRGYRDEDLEVMFALGTASGFCAILVITQYLSSPEVIALYSHPQRLWLICPLLLYWIGRILLLARRNEMHDDPIIFAARDRTSWLTAVAAGAIMLVAI